MHQALVDQAKRGDREAFDALARTVGDRCMAIAFRILRDADRAQDATQAALIVAWRELRTLRDSDRFEPWLHRILTNECYRRGRLHPRSSHALLPCPGPHGPDQLRVASRRRLVGDKAATKAPTCWASSSG